MFVFCVCVFFFFFISIIYSFAAMGGVALKKVFCLVRKSMLVEKKFYHSFFKTFTSIAKGEKHDNNRFVSPENDLIFPQRHLFHSYLRIY